jgi:hypothetical protein
VKSIPDGVHVLDSAEVDLEDGLEGRLVEAGQGPSRADRLELGRRDVLRLESI